MSPEATGTVDGQAVAAEAVAAAVVAAAVVAGGTDDRRHPRPRQRIDREDPMTALTRRTVVAPFARRLKLAAALAAVVIALAALPVAAASFYGTPEAALQAFRAAVDGEGGKGLLDLFGKQYEADLIGGDPAEARQNIQALRRMAAQRMTLESDGEGRMSIIMGRRGWPMPIPGHTLADSAADAVRRKVRREIPGCVATVVLLHRTTRSTADLLT
jgi:hypothetical protein